MSIEVNGVTLPDIPSEVLEQYPYVFIVYIINNSTEQYSAVCATEQFLYAGAEVTGELGVLFPPDFTATYTGLVTTTLIDTWESVCAVEDQEWVLQLVEPGMTVVWSNYDILSITALNEETGEYTTGDVWFARNDSDPNYYAPKSWFDGMARQVMRLTGTSDKLNTDKMLEMLTALNADSGGDTGGGAVTIVPWSTGTDEEIAAMVAAMDAGTLSIEDTGWAIGDERTVTLAAMAATGVGESHAEQTVTLVLMDSQHYTLTEATAGGDTQDHFVVGLKNCLNETGYMNSTGTNIGSWDGCARRTWCNEVFRAAIPETLRSCFKQFKVPTATEYNASTVTESDDYFALFAEKEVFGSKTHSNSSEATSLSQIEWYATAANRIKTSNGATCVWWERSPRSESSTAFCGVTTSAGADWYGPMNPKGISPFGCI